MKLDPAVRKRTNEVAQALAAALGDGMVCIAVYGSAAGEDFAPGYSDVNLVIVLHRVTHADLRLIGATFERMSANDPLFATPLVITPSFLRDARDSFPMELDDIRERHELLAGTDIFGDVLVSRDRLREQAEHDARAKLLRLRTLVIHRPPDAEIHFALAGLVSTLAVIQRTLLGTTPGDERLRGTPLFDAVRRETGATMETVKRLYRMREGTERWVTGADLDDLVAAALGDVEALVAYVDRHGS